MSAFKWLTGLSREFDGSRSAGVYVILCNANLHVYVGSTSDLLGRRAYHFSRLRRGLHPNQHLQSAYRLYGKDAFDFRCLRYIPGQPTKKFLVAFENLFLLRAHRMDPSHLFNMQVPAVEDGVNHTPEIRAKLSKSNTAAWRRPGVRQRNAMAISVGMMEWSSSPAVRARKSEILKRRWEEDPEKQRHAVAVRWSDPAARERQGALTRGENSAVAKLTNADVLHIRAEYAKLSGIRGEVVALRRRLAEELGVSEAHVKDIYTRRVWKHI